MIVIANSDTASWGILPSQIVQNYTKARLITQAEANAVVGNAAYGPYSSATQIGNSPVITLTATPIDISTITPMSNGHYKYRVNANYAYGGLVLIK